MNNSSLHHIPTQTDRLHACCAKSGMHNLVIGLCIAFAASVLFAGCGPRPPQRDDIRHVKAEGIEHIVEEGDTFLAIARLYGVAPIDLHDSNEVPNLTRLEVGSSLFVPGATEPQRLKDAPQAEFETKAAVVPLNSRRQTIRSELYYVSPARGTVIRKFGEGTLVGENHGIDIRGVTGSPVVAVKSGQVLACPPMGDWGNVVVINHGEGENTVYTHLRSIEVAPGDMVKQGQVIGRMGTSPRTNEPSLHFRIYREGKPIDPDGRFAVRVNE